MKSRSPLVVVFAMVATALSAFGQAGHVYTNFIRQTQLPSGVTLQVAADTTGEGRSQLGIEQGGSAVFELWTIRADPYEEYLLDSKYVGNYLPVATVSVVTEDPPPENDLNRTPRTRADRPFTVNITTTGIRAQADADAPEASKSVTLRRHSQSYGEDGYGENIDREQATEILPQESLTENTVHSVIYPPGGALAALPEFAADITKVRGEERFSVWSVTDNKVPEDPIPPTQIASMDVQIWPEADGTIAGIEQDQVIHFDMPPLTFTLNDLYPDSHTYAQVYAGEPSDGVVGTSLVSRTLYQTTPESIVLFVNNDWAYAVPEDGRWTLELLTETPFDTVLLSRVTFTVDRAMRVNGSISTLK